MEQKSKTVWKALPSRWQPPPLIGQALLLTTASPTGAPHLEATTRVSLLTDEPPLLSLALAESSTAQRHLRKTRGFVVNVVSEEQTGLWWAAGNEAHSGLDRITRLGIGLERSSVGAPRIVECPAHLECEIVERRPLPGATLFIAEVKACVVDSALDRAPSLRERLQRLAPICWLRYEEDYYCALKAPRRA